MISPPSSLKFSFGNRRNGRAMPVAENITFEAVCYIFSRRRAKLLLNLTLMCGPSSALRVRRAALALANKEKKK